MKIKVEKCSRCRRTETARWYGKTTDSPYCCSCYRKEYVANNREKALKAQRKANSSEKSKASRKLYAKTENGRVLKRKSDKKRYWSNPEKFRAKNRTEEQRERLRLHYKNNKGYYKEKSARRSRNLDKASIGNYGKNEVVKIYSECPLGFEVDHIVPIKGYDFFEGDRVQVVCGLHVPWNLQYLPSENNRKKSCNLYSMEEQ